MQTYANIAASGGVRSRRVSGRFAPAIAGRVAPCSLWGVPDLSGALLKFLGHRASLARIERFGYTHGYEEHN